MELDSVSGGVPGVKQEEVWPDPGRLMQASGFQQAGVVLCSNPEGAATLKGVPGRLDTRHESLDRFVKGPMWPRLS